MPRWGGAKFSLRLSAILCAIGCFGPAKAHADTTAALKAVTDTTESVCGIIKTSGEYRSAKVTGAVKISLTGLVSRLADLGLSLDSNVGTTAYEGVLQSDLAADLKNLRDCKTHVFDVLQAKMLNAAALATSSQGEISSEETPLDNIPGRWTTGSPKQCSVAFYVWTVLGEQSTFRDQSEQVDIERIIKVSGNSVMTMTLFSVHHSKGIPESAGSKWQYIFQTSNYVHVKNLSDGRTFELRRCVDSAKSN